MWSRGRAHETKMTLNPRTNICIPYILNKLLTSLLVKNASNAYLFIYKRKLQIYTYLHMYIYNINIDNIYKDIHVDTNIGIYLQMCTIH